MALPHLVMKHWDPMIGIDIHIPTIPAPPGKGPPAPYATFDLLSGLFVGFTPMKKHPSLYGIVVAKGTDIGTMIPHVGPPHLTLMVDMIFSSSKSHFGSATYKAEKKNPALAVALFANINLNCGTPCPTPTGIVTCFNTHGAAMSTGDILAGFFSMASDWALQTVLNALGDKYGDAFGKVVGRMLGPIGRRFPSLVTFAAKNGGSILSFLVGGPMGMDIGSFGGYGTDQDGNAITPGGFLGSFNSSTAENLGQALGDYIDGGPGNIEPPTYQQPTGGPSPKIPNVTDW